MRENRKSGSEEGLARWLNDLLHLVDFICFEKMLIIEIDGGQHNESKQQDYDDRRTQYLKKLGYRVSRFWNNDVLTHFDAVMDQIHYEVLL